MMESQRIRLPLSRSGRHRCTTTSPSGVSLTARCSTDRTTGFEWGSASRYTPATESQRTDGPRRSCLVSISCVFQPISTRPLAARTRIALRCDSAAARPGRSGGMMAQAPEGGGARRRMRRAHRPSRTPRRRMREARIGSLCAPVLILRNHFVIRMHVTIRASSTACLPGGEAR
jgi:hypothetical protein